MKVWSAYAATALGVLAVAVVVTVLVVGSGATSAIVVAAVVAYVVQLAAFGGLVVAGGRPERFLVGWAGGIALRFAVVGVVAWWVMRTEALPARPLLLSLVAFIFVLVLMEPVFLRKGSRAE